MRTDSPRILGTAGWLLAGFLIWVMATPCMGIDHDARLYVLMALRHMDPAAYVRDPWFAWGSQDDWSAYSPLLAWALKTWGVSSGALVVTFLQGALFVSSVWLVSRAWLRTAVAPLVFLLVVSIPIYYSPRGMLSVSEGFATARGMAVPLSLLALAVLRRRPWLAAVLHVAAMAMHPIMGLGPALVSCLVYPRRRVAVGLAVAGLAAMAGLFAGAYFGFVHLLSGEWYDYVKPAVLVFVIPWLQEDADRLMAVFFVLLLGVKAGSPRARPLYAASAIVGIGGLAVSGLADAYPVLIVLKAQLWRMAWLSFLVACQASGDLLGRHVLRRHAPHRLLLMPVLMALYWICAILGLRAALLAAMVASVLFLWPRSQLVLFRLSTWLVERRAWVWSGIGLAAALAIPGYLLSLELAASSISGEAGPEGMMEGLFRSGGYGLLALGMFIAMRRFKALIVWPAVLAVLVVSATRYWDVRSPVQQAQEMRYTVDGSLNPFAGLIKRGEVVYWHQYPERVWMELGTAGYGSTTHCTGLVYSKERTLLLKDRMLRVAGRSLSKERFRLGQEHNMLPEMALLTVRPGAVPRPDVLASYESRAGMTAFGLQYLCGDPQLDWVIDATKLNTGREAIVRRPSGTGAPLYLYDCRDIRRMGSL